jgi:predicted HicB family RNase H-like nuclease
MGAKDEKIIRTTIRVPEKLWEKTKHAAIRDHISLQELVIKGLEAYLKGGK